MFLVYDLCIAMFKGFFLDVPGDFPNVKKILKLLYMYVDINRVVLTQTPLQA